MALQSEEEWRQFFQEIGIPAEQASQYARIFAENRITDALLSELDKPTLKELGITSIGHILSILKYSKPTEETKQAIIESKSKAPSIKPPKITSEMTKPQFRKFLIDWDIFKNLTSIPTDQVNAQLYAACDDAVQTSIINTIPDFQHKSEENLLNEIQSIVTQKSNPAIHRMTFGSLIQADIESIHDFVVKLKSLGIDCEFSCPNCNYNLLDNHVKDQLIRGLHNNSIQTDILAKANQLKTLQDVIKHAEAYETALRDQTKIQQSAEASVAGISEYKRNKTAQKSNANKCSGCGSNSHGLPGSNDRSSKCPAWGKTCSNCHIPNHYASVCRRPKRQINEANALIASLTYNKQDGTFKPTSCSSAVEIPAMLISTIKNATNQPTKANIYHDPGATICLAGPNHLNQLRIDKQNLIPCHKDVKTAGGFKLTCYGWLPIKFKVGIYETTQPLFICEKISRLYFSKTACIETKLIPEAFPAPVMRTSEEIAVFTADKILSTPEKTKAPSRPEKLPFPPTKQNIPKLENFIKESFASTAFMNSPPFPSMASPPAHIHLKENAIPYAKHSPIPIPYHWKAEVKASLDRDVERGIIAPVPVGTPVDWCTTMVVRAKKDGKPRRTIDLQKLNTYCKRETHHCSSPFQLASQVPGNTFKTVIDATDGYHSVLLDKESQLLTSFITEWGRFMYLRLPQGLMAAGDAYTRRYDDIIDHVKDKVKCIDDTLLYDVSIEDAFYHTWDYLMLLVDNGIVANPEKFQFAKETITFAGLKLTPYGVAPSDETLSAILNFPTPKDLTGARSWFGLVNQVAWSYSLSDIMQPFRDLIRPKSKFYWDETLENIFINSKEKLIQLVKDGIKVFDPKRRTCLQCDWSKTGLGYLILQKYCDCNMDNAPVCCPEGWHLVYASSRFTLPSESRYAPTEGESLSISWGLNHGRMYTLGCDDLIVVTDHKPLLNIFNDRDLDTISNPRIQDLKEKTLSFRFSIQYCKGKWHRGPDTFSRYPVDVANCVISEQDNIQAENRDDLLVAAITNSLENATDKIITTSELQKACSSDEQYCKLTEQIQEGFPNTIKEIDVDILEFWGIRDRLSLTQDNIVLVGQRVVIPRSLRKYVLRTLHSAHQGLTGMRARANQCVYWPGLDASLRCFKAQCRDCITNAKSQQREPIILTPPPQWPFQHVCVDYFEISSHVYISIVDNYSGWIIIYHFKPGQANRKTLISTCRGIFIMYGVPEKLHSDGGPQFVANDFENFLQNWGVKHRTSSSHYPQSNGRAELGVKSAKRIINGNTDKSGSLDNDKAARAILQYRNTPIPDINLSPAQILFHRQLRDHIPANPKLYELHPDWLLSAKQREESVSKRNERLMKNYNKTARLLPELPVGTLIVIQNRDKVRAGKWDRTGHIIEKLDHRQYLIRMDGSGRVTRQNRRFIREYTALTPSQILPSPYLPSAPPHDNVTEANPQEANLPEDSDTDSTNSQVPPPHVQNGHDATVPPEQTLRRSARTHKPPVRLTSERPGEMMDSTCTH